MSTAAQQPGRFGHHPDPACDFCVEVEVIDGQVYEAKVGMIEPWPVLDRIDRAMDFCVGGDEIAVRAKLGLRQMERDLQNRRAEPVQ